MIDRAALLHNMSAPPKSVITYAGLSAESNLDKRGSNSAKHDKGNVFGEFVGFRFPKGMRARSPEAILERLGEEVGLGAGPTLLRLIEQRALELPIPDGCVVKPFQPEYPSPWPDLLATLAVITKSSANVWLRSKAPSLSKIAKRSSLSLLLPPTFIASLQEKRQ